MRKWQILVNSGADIKASNQLQGALERSYEKVVQMLVEKGAAVDSVGTEYGRCRLLTG